MRTEYPRLRMREEPRDNEIIDENGTPVSYDGLLLLVFIAIVVIGTLLTR